MTIEQRLQVAELYSSSRKHFRPGFSDVTDFPANQTESDGLLKTLGARERSGRLRNTLSFGEIAAAVKNAEQNGTVDDIFDEIGLRILQETSFLIAGQQVSVTYSVLGLDTSVRVIWGHTVIENGKEVGGRYIHEKKLIEIALPYPTSSERIQSLAGFGKVTASDEIFIHEQTHAIQFHGASGRIHPELIEAQAYRTGQDTLAEFTHKNLVKYVTFFEPYSHLDERKFQSAVWFVDRFNALGISQDELADFVRNPGQWIESDGVWSDLEAVLRYEMHDKGVGNTELERAVLAGDLLKAIERQKVKKITQEVLYQRFGTEIETKREEERWLREIEKAREAGIFLQM